MLLLTIVTSYVLAQFDPAPYFRDAPIYRRCNRTDHVFAAELSRGEVLLPLSRNEFLSSEQNITISGNIQIIDGCTVFKV
jgi:hypothetical protein